MACSLEFIDNICLAISPLGEVTSRKMMGDFLIYLNGKCVITACDNIAFIKKMPCIEKLMGDAESGSPYPGAKEAYILDFSDKRKALQIIEILRDNLPSPKKKTNWQYRK